MDVKTRNKKCSETIKHLLTAYNLTQNEFAKKVGVSEAIVSRWLKGDRLPTPKNIEQITKTFGILERELYEGINPVDSKSQCRSILLYDSNDIKDIKDLKVENVKYEITLPDYLFSNDDIYFGLLGNNKNIVIYKKYIGNEDLNRETICASDNVYGIVAGYCFSQPDKTISFMSDITKDIVKVDKNIKKKILGIRVLSINL